MPTPETTEDVVSVRYMVDDVEAALGFYTLSWLARKNGHRGLGILLSTDGLLLMSFSAYLGGEISYALGQGVNRNAWSPDVADLGDELDDFRPVAKLDDVREGRLTAAELDLGESKIPLVLMRRGNEVKVNTVSLVRYPASFNPGTGKSLARAPVAITARSNSRRWPSTSAACGPTKRPLPTKTSTPSFVNRSTESWSLMPARSLRMRSIAALNATVGSQSRCTPNSAPLRAS